MAFSYYSVIADNRKLEAHGFDHWPNGEELARYLFRIEDEVDMLAARFGYRFGVDIRNRVHLEPLQGGDDYDRA